jgi:hypothetical protein
MISAIDAKGKAAYVTKQDNDATFVEQIAQQVKVGIDDADTEGLCCFLVTAVAFLLSK